MNFEGIKHSVHIRQGCLFLKALLRKGAGEETSMVDKRNVE
jgi:hypothetical protein